MQEARYFALAATLWVGYQAWRRFRLLSWLPSYVLENVKVPVALLPEADADEEGLVACNIHVHNGKVAAVLYKDDDTSLWRFDWKGCIVLPCFCDAHTHLVKTHTAPRNRNDLGTISRALAWELDDQPWGAEDITRRMDFALRCALHHGSRAVRTHLDGLSPQVWRAFDQAREKYKKKGLILQGVANLYLPLYLQDQTRHCDEAKRHENVVLGAYCGTDYSVAALDALFKQAHRVGLDVDLHIDETNDPECCALLALVDALETARNCGYKGRVVLGHCTALSLQSDDTKKKVLDGLARLKDVYVVANPTTNLGLQDRNGSEAPHCRPIPNVPRTPMWRGITLFQELRAAGVAVAAASDNVRDHWHSYGDYDMLFVWGLMQALGHLDTAPNEGAWADIVTDTAAQAMGLPKALAYGSPADLVLFPSARRANELFARPQVDRIVLRNGKIQSTTLPRYDEMDDLVANKTQHNLPKTVMRGATTTS